jgi:cell wall-associated NlpC family hydrolase
MASWWTSYIRQQAKARGLDPNAVLAVASQEGLSGRVGDQGTSYGPFQLHRGGALPRGRNRQWAESRAGIDYALNQIQGVAGGQRGRRAITNIVSRFERPANVQKEIQGALGAYGRGGGAPAFAGTPLQAYNSPQIRTQQNDQAARAGLAQSLIAGLQGIQHHQTPDFGTQFSLVSALQSPTSPGKPIPVVVQGYSHGGANPRVNQVVKLAKSYLGTPYVWGGSRPGGFDCSGLLQYTWARRGVHIPRTTYDQWRTGRAVGKGQLRPGDAVFFEAGSKGPGHVGMYIGNGRFIEAPHTGAVVRISKLAGRPDYVGARRFR